MSKKYRGENTPKGVTFRSFQLEKITRLAEQKGISFSQMVREIVDDYNFNDELAGGSLPSAGIAKK